MTQTIAVACAGCGTEGGVLATLPGFGPVVYCTTCRLMLGPEGWDWPLPLDFEEERKSE